MQTHLLLSLMITLTLCQLIAGLVTLQTIRNLTEVTDECRERILESWSGSVSGGEVEGAVIDEMARVLGGVGGQVVLTVDGDKEEVEDVSFISCSLG